MVNPSLSVLPFRFGPISLCPSLWGIVRFGEGRGFCSGVEVLHNDCPHPSHYTLPSFVPLYVLLDGCGILQFDRYVEWWYVS
jgi:hypothetical protein